MKRNLNIRVRHLSRVEGHGNIDIEIKNGKLVKARWEVVETPRFFEAMLKGMPFHMAPLLTSRICGICSIGHSLASLRAVERAMEVRIPLMANQLRLLAKHGETIQSHALHLFFLAAPDFFQVDSVIPLIETQPEIVRTAARLKGLGNRICDRIAGRSIHPVSLVVGGLSKMPTKQSLEELRSRIQECIPDILSAIDLFKTLSFPDFQRETEFVSLKGDRDYPWIGGDLISSDGVQKAENEYLEMTNEYMEDFSTSKFARLSRASFAVGALARYNNNHPFLHKKARDVAKSLDLKPISHNPFMNNVAQLVECYHVMLESMEILDRLIDSGEESICERYEIKAGDGVGAVEVPRGVLYHHITIDRKGKITRANCVIPTTQNNANIHFDLRELVEQQVALKKNDKEITKLGEMMVRSYDPCISCSVH